MKIAQIAPVWYPVPPKGYGGIELIVSLLTEELVKRGHEVTLFTNMDGSESSTTIKGIYYESQQKKLGHIIPDLLHVTYALKEIQKENFDLIHNHAGYSGVALSSFISTPVVTTLHGPGTEDNYKFFEYLKDSCYYVSISNKQREFYPKLKYGGTVYNAIDVSLFDVQEKKEDYFVYISRCCEEKGTHLAIEIAKRAGVKLVMSCKVDKKDQNYFKKFVKPHIDDKQIVFLREISHGIKVNLFKQAKGFIFPLQWHEPFGLVLIESMACGTPIVTLPYGAIPEVVDDELGWICEGVEQMVTAVREVDSLPDKKRAALSRACRAHVENKFSAQKMTDAYEEVYQKVVREQHPSPVKVEV